MVQTIITVSVTGYQKFLIDAEVYEDDVAVTLIEDRNKIDECLEFQGVIEIEHVDQN